MTGAEFASAYNALGSEVVLVSSRDRVLPGEDPDASAVLEDVFTRRGMSVLSNSRADRVERDGDGVRVTLTDGQVVRGSHCLVAVGSVPNTSGLGLDEAGVSLDQRSFIEVDKVSRTTARGVYAAGDCTGVLMLASVAAMQGRIAMWHALGDAVQPLDLKRCRRTCSRLPRSPRSAGRSSRSTPRRSRQTRSRSICPATHDRRCKARATGSSSFSAAGVRERDRRGGGRTARLRADLSGLDGGLPGV